MRTILTILVVIPLIPQASATISDEIDTQLSGVIDFDGIPAESAELIFSNADGTFSDTVSTDENGVYSFELDGEYFKSGDQFHVQIKYIDEEGNQIYLSTCKIKLYTNSQALSFSLSGGYHNVGWARWTNTGPNYDDYELTYDISQTGAIQTSTTNDLTFSLTYHWHDDFQLICDHKIEVNVYLQFYPHITNVIGSINIDRSDDSMTYSYERIDLCGDPNDGGKESSDPSVYVYISDFSVMESFSMTQKIAFSLEWNYYELAGEEGAKYWNFVDSGEEGSGEDIFGVATETTLFNRI
tara:strand:- start:869 stop:1759 length:891 start_codon:yes stop_codon:yes gene_type:complete